VRNVEQIDTALDFSELFKHEVLCERHIPRAESRIEVVSGTALRHGYVKRAALTWSSPACLSAGLAHGNKPVAVHGDGAGRRFALLSLNHGRNVHSPGRLILQGRLARPLPVVARGINILSIKSVGIRGEVVRSQVAFGPIAAGYQQPAM